MGFLLEALFWWNDCSKNANISNLSNFLAIFSNSFLDIEKFYQVLSTCQISDQLDYSNRNYRGKNLRPTTTTSAIPICKSLACLGLMRLQFSCNYATFCCVDVVQEVRVGPIKSKLRFQHVVVIYHRSWIDQFLCYSKPSRISTNMKWARLES